MKFNDQISYWTHMLDEAMRNEIINEAITIPDTAAGEVEKKLRAKMQSKEFVQRYPKFKYHDTILKCCRNDEKMETDKKSVERTYIAGLPNIMDMLDIYDKFKKSTLRKN